ncbi:hypothetical protein, partial [Macrococcoides bohemicum]|uniref:hypothetical protein n=1 Tax=Macrococcoides bohemicum TaxID=1903056 RepID=UPI00165D81B4
MSKQWYENFVIEIKNVILKKINDKEVYLWRNLVVRKNQLNFEMINLIAFYIKSKYKLEWKYSIEALNSEIYEESISMIKKNINLFDGDIKEIDLSYIYQLLLSDEIILINNTYKYISDKYSRDNIGSYYTPIDLSIELTKKTIDSYLIKKCGTSLYNIDMSNRNIIIRKIRNTKVADLSVGAGSFLLAYLIVIKKFITNDKKIIKEVCNNIWGIDVDPIALLICEYNISMKNLNDISNINLILGNPLIESYKNINKLEISRENRIYSNEIG